MGIRLGVLYHASLTPKLFLVYQRIAVHAFRNSERSSDAPALPEKELFDDESIEVV